MHPLIILLVGIVVVLGAILWLRLHAFLALLLASLVVAAITPGDAIRRYGLDSGMSALAAERLAQEPVGERVAAGFGRTTGQIGIMIAMASIIGTCLLESGSADRIVRSSLALLGEARASVSFLGSGFLLGIPVFFDTVFYLLMPLGKATRIRTGRDYLLYILAIVAGGTMTHSLVPPTPGPLFVANALKIDLAVMIAGGCVVGAVTASLGYAFARWANHRWDIPLRESESSMKQLQALSQADPRSLPPTWLALMPILLPVALITAGSILSSATASGGASPWREIQRWIVALGNKNIALALGAAVAMTTLYRKTSLETTVQGIRTALESAGIIILITSAGGAFGSALQQTGIASSIERLAANYQVSVIPLAFFLTVLIRTAQGSATVAMLTAAGVFAGMADAAQLGFHPVYLALAIGCGSKPIWWMNDSGFWVVTQMSGMSESEGLRTLTPMAALMGVAGLLVTMAGAWLLPLR
jgi:GntP family gluconate:H+ symporter